MMSRLMINRTRTSHLLILSLLSSFFPPPLLCGWKHVIIFTPSPPWGTNIDICLFHLEKNSGLFIENRGWKKEKKSRPFFPSFFLPFWPQSRSSGVVLLVKVESGGTSTDRLKEGPGGRGFFVSWLGPTSLTFSISSLFGASSLERQEVSMEFWKIVLLNLSHSTTKSSFDVVELRSELKEVYIYWSFYFIFKISSASLLISTQVLSVFFCIFLAVFV